MECSVAIATRNKATLLRKTLDSICYQKPPFEWELIVVDDGSTDETRSIIQQFPRAKYIYRERNEYGNPAPARNVSYRMASGRVIICQSDDVVHTQDNVVERLVNELESQSFLLATVWNGLTIDDHAMEYSGNGRPRPFFFLGSLLREHLYAVGGNDEEFVEPGFDDDWFACCLLEGLKLRMVISDSIVGWHQHHSRPELEACFLRMREIHTRKYNNAKAGLGDWCASGGPWPYIEGESLT